MRRAAVAAAWLAAWTVALAATSTAALAEPGEVQTTDGRRHRGEVEQVVPGVSARLRLPSGELRTFDWSEVRFVLDGDRVFDAAGNQGRIPVGLGGVSFLRPQLTIVVETEDTARGRRLRPGRFAPPPGSSEDAWLHARPRFGATVVLAVSGSLLLTGSLGALVGSAVEPCVPDASAGPGDYRCTQRRTDLLVSSFMGISGSLMVGFASWRIRLHRASDAEWLRLARGTAASRALHPAIRLGSDGVAAHVRLVF